MKNIDCLEINDNFSLILLGDLLNKECFVVKINSGEVIDLSHLLRNGNIQMIKFIQNRDDIILMTKTKRLKIFLFH